MSLNKLYYCHPQSLVETSNIGEGTSIWAFVHILPEAIIGKRVNICDHCFIENDVRIGDDVTLKCGVFIWNGIVLEDNVFVGPNVVFTNDVRPRSKNSFYKLQRTIIRQGASLGANSTVLAGVIIGKYAMTGIGAVVTRSVPDYSLVYGNPARQYGWVDEHGNKLSQVISKEKRWISVETGCIYEESDNGLVKI